MIEKRWFIILTKLLQISYDYKTSGLSFTIHTKTASLNGEAAVSQQVFSVSANRSFVVYQRGAKLKIEKTCDARMAHRRFEFVLQKRYPLLTQVNRQNKNGTWNTNSILLFTKETEMII